MTARQSESRDTGDLLRRLFLGFGALIVVATLAELAFERHWNTPVRLIPWAAIGVAGVSLTLVAVAKSARTIRIARLLAVAVILSAAYGTYAHIDANYDAGPLSAKYSATWETMSTGSKWLKAATKGVGPSPILASGVLAQAALCALAATVGHPAGSKRTP